MKYKNLLIGVVAGLACWCDDVEIFSSKLQNPLLGGRIQIWVGEDHVLEKFIGPDIPLLQLHHSSSGLRENPAHSKMRAYVSALTNKV